MRVKFSFVAIGSVDVDLNEEDAKNVKKGSLTNLSDEAYEKILNTFNSADIDEVELTDIWGR